MTLSLPGLPGSQDLRGTSLRHLPASPTPRVGTGTRFSKLSSHRNPPPTTRGPVKRQSAVSTHCLPVRCTLHPCSLGVSQPGCSPGAGISHKIPPGGGRGGAAAAVLRTLTLRSTGSGPQSCFPPSDGGFVLATTAVCLLYLPLSTPSPALVSSPRFTRRGPAWGPGATRDPSSLRVCSWGCRPAASGSSRGPGGGGPRERAVCPPRHLGRLFWLFDPGIWLPGVWTGHEWGHRPRAALLEARGSRGLWDNGTRAAPPTGQPKGRQGRPVFCFNHE